MPQKRRAVVPAREKYPRKTVELSYHERMFIAVYRTLEDSEQRAVDRSLSYEWSGRKREANPKLTAEEIQRSNDRFAEAFRALFGPSESSDALV